MNDPIARLEDELGYRFTNRELLVRALKHSSRAAERGDGPNEDNEQFEFLGDSVLGFVVSEALVEKYPAASEGQLSRWKSYLVSAAHLHHCAQTIRLGDFLLLGRGEEQNGGRERKTLLANALEAVIAAIHLDGEMAPARSFIRKLVLMDDLDDESFETSNSKSALQEWTQSLGLPIPRYATVETSGPDHAKLFTVEARVGDRYSSRATGRSKKVAGQEAAQGLIDQLKPTEME
ncbi:MAG TPA: ribonuclease III [Bryobacteraceae bacterium]|nr:ribonuclease III [Bryobacteraceae bacterium]